MVVYGDCVKKIDKYLISWIILTWLNDDSYDIYWKSMMVYFLSMIYFIICDFSAILSFGQMI